ncbi:hypothetical protein ONE63_010927 [Megalurothrips usitatus]|uniref:Nuclear RNA export factor 1-like n=1 Tax=Megalurothrips usitatus TaxID=439358 RepID=A0AAV7XFI4_9NEOP|nr:hypothetical protein ONE63_010927 [Megalurothrips usitatus]
MPKRGGMGRPYVNSYYEHDNRGEEVRRTVSFKNVGGHPSGGVNSRAMRTPANDIRRNLTNHLRFTTDVEMGEGGRGNVVGRKPAKLRGFPARGRRRNARQNSPAPMRSFQRLMNSSSYWYRIIIPHGARYEQKWIIDCLNASIAPDTFTPIAFQTLGKDALFYLDDHQISSKLLNLNRRLDTEDGYKLGVLVRPQANLNITVDDTLKEILKSVMARRFRSDVRSLDLSRFHADPDLIDKLVPLNQKSVLSAVLSLVAEHCPSLHALDLSYNQIYSLDGMKSLVSKLSNLRILHLAKNQLDHIKCLDALKGLSIEELLMDANPLCGKYADEGAYVTDVRKRLPKLLKLDNRDLPPPILFDVETAQLPPSRGSYLCAEEGKDIVRQFLEQYYAIYDSPNREPLRDAYHENAKLSMSCNNQITQSQSSGNRDKPLLGAYHSSNRNLKRVSELDRRMRLLMCGHTEIMKHLCSLPSSQHDPHSFAVDLLLFTPQLIQLCVCGVFREARSAPNVPVRAFSRSLVIVPQGQGFCIVNETINITNATTAQADAAFKTSLAPVAPVPSVSSPVVPLVPVPVAPSIGMPSQDIEVKRQMVEHVTKVTGMNLTWSEK